MLQTEDREQSKDHHREHRHRNGGADGEPGLEAEVGVGGTEDEAENNARKSGLEGEFGRRLARCERNVFLAWLDLVGVRREFFDGRQSVGDPTKCSILKFGVVCMRHAVLHRDPSELRNSELRTQN